MSIIKLSNKEVFWSIAIIMIVFILGYANGYLKDKDYNSCEPVRQECNKIMKTFNEELSRITQCETKYILVDKNGNFTESYTMD